ncbi:MAG: hypothetical protein KDA98_02230 [Acidimicrobiales bacterium]|nr:hypothetical protein [Acidimicrobiales bacterium]
MRSTAPVRVADVGGWTDTWFGSPGQVCSVAVGPAVSVEARLVDRGGTGSSARAGVAAGGASTSVVVRSPAMGIDLVVGPDPERGWAAPTPGVEPLLEHAVAAVVGEVDLDDQVGVEVDIASAVPPGASLGTSASVLVALLGALDVLVAGGRRSAAEIARLAHEVETTRAGRQAGVQDQWAAAVGGAQHLVVSPYPDVRSTPVPLSRPTVEALDRRLVTVVFGPHDSSAVHHEVIDAVVSCGGVEHDGARRALGTLARLAAEAASALGAGDVDGWGSVLVEATEAQRALHPALVGPAHQVAIDLARSLGAVGWKVNGAGGSGGSLTILAGVGADASWSAPRPQVSASAPASAGDLAAALRAVDPAWQVLDLTVSSGLEVVVRP